jgi:hypothetical protein
MWLVVATVLGLPGQGTAQPVELSAGVLFAHETAPLGSHVAPMVSVALRAELGRFPVLLEAGFARSDFDSFGEAFHRNYGVFTLGSEWMPVRGTTRAGLRLGVGAVVEDDESEVDPAFTSSGNWAEAVVFGLVIRRRLGSGRDLVFSLSDHVLGPVNAIFDPVEYDVEHRFRVLLGLRF